MSSELIERLRILEAELERMRKIAAEPHAIRVVHDELGPLSLWSNKALENEIAWRVRAATEKAEAELAAVRADAERYRWLRDHGDETHNGVQLQITRYGKDASYSEHEPESCGLLYGAADAAIDAAMQSKGEQ